MEPADDSALAGASADEAVVALHAEHARGLVRLAVLLLGDQAAAEDVVQDAFVALHGRWSGLDEPDRAAAYLRRSVVNGARNAAARRRTVVRFLARSSEPEPAPGADQHAIRAELRDQVTGALARLPRRQREVLVLRHYLDLSESQIADALGISAGSVKTHASRGAAALRTALEEIR